jgi:3-methyladenine DNA glycosylase AlkC
MADQLKDQFFTDEFIRKLAAAIEIVEPAFDIARFDRLIHRDAFESMALKQKMRHVTICLHTVLSSDYAQALTILRQVGPAFSGFNAMVFPDYVECYGLEHWDLSMDALAEFTLLCSSEFAVRPFIAADAERAMPYLYAWSKDDNEHLRRLSSEGCRPRLPWAMALPAFKTDPSPILPILETLRDDRSAYVRKSVANNLNDISKDNPQVVLDVCERWQGHSSRTDWIIKHGCRTLLKAGNTRALMLFGFADPDGVAVRELTLDNDSPRIGDSIRFSYELCVEGDEVKLLRQEFIVTYVKALGKRSGKVFQIGESEIGPGVHTVTRKLSFADLSTRKHHAGPHEIAIVVNGVEMASIALDLRARENDD